MAELEQSQTSSSPHQQSASPQADAIAVADTNTTEDEQGEVEVEPITAVRQSRPEPADSEQKVGPNVLIKVPGTDQGAKAKVRGEL